MRTSQPQHVTLRAVAAVGSLRRSHAYRAVRAALVVSAARTDFRIVHLSLQGTHIHVLCEADDRLALARGVQSLQISAAKHLHRELAKRGGPRRGQVFTDRYHAVSISSVRQARHALAYVLNNWRRHRVDQRTAGLFGGRIDPYSSGNRFPGWREPLLGALPEGYEPLRVASPQSWLLTDGYKRARPISVFEVPGPEPD